MKKGVLNKLVFLFLCTLFFLNILSFFALSFPSTSSSSEKTATEKSQSGPVETNSQVPGYWMGFGADKDGEVTKHYYPLDSSAKKPTEGPTDLSYLTRTQGSGWTLNINRQSGKDLYSLFGFNVASYELQYVVFALDMYPFPEKGGQNTSHAYPYDKSGYEGGDSGKDCITCDNLDKLDECTNGTDTGFPLGGSCIYVNILDRNDCTNEADWSQQYCEGVGLIGANSKTINTIADFSPGGAGNAGYGGCQESPSTTADPRDYGRDWYNADTPKTDTTFISPSMNVFGDSFSDRGRCCGNDPVWDIGNLAKNPDANEAAKSPNAYICHNDTTVNANGDFIWDPSRSTTNFYRIINLTFIDAHYQAVSNFFDWFICDSSGNSKPSTLYNPVTFKSGAANDWEPGIGRKAFEKGVLLTEYMGLPLVSGNVDSDTATPLKDGGSSEVEEHWTGDLPNGATASESHIIDEKSFSGTDYKSSGPSKITACDKDGDGYDGHWSPDKSGDGIYDPSGDCKNPKEPFDCDDVSSDDETKGFKGMSVLKHPGATDYCKPNSKCDGGDCDLDCSFNKNCIVDPLAGVPDADKAKTAMNPTYNQPRYVCFNVNDRGEFAECCGLDRAYCNNPGSGRRVGSMLHTIREFDDYDADEIQNSEELGKTNFVLRYGMSDVSGVDMINLNKDMGEDTIRFALFTESADLNITNWNHYQYLEFYIWFTGNFELELWVGMYGGSGSQNDYVSYAFPFKVKIVDYVVNEPELNKWLHVVIPTSRLWMPNFRPDVIVFAADIAKLQELGKAYIDNEPYSNVIGIDKIHLRPWKVDMEPQMGSDAENAYCTGTWPPTWINNLDEKRNPFGTKISQLAGMYACDSIPSYGWTGTMCCGDDNGNNTNVDGKYPAGQTAFKEFYSDITAGCWAGNRIAENTRLMIVKYGIAYPGFLGWLDRSCRNSSCIYSLPSTENILASNPYPDLYDLSFVSGTDLPQKIGAAGISKSANPYLKADNVPMQLLYYRQAFSSCNALPDYFKDILNTTNGKKLVSQNFESPNKDGQCSVLGAYYCDLSTGENLGWDDTRLRIYPGTLNLTAKDGKHVPLKYEYTDSDGAKKEGVYTYANATLRIEIKRNYNLIDNGGFEDV
jgi:hypothetical protein